MESVAQALNGLSNAMSSPWESQLLFGEVFITIRVSLQRTPRIFFGAADPGDETYDRLSWDEVKPTADLVLYEGFDEEHFFNL